MSLSLFFTRPAATERIPLRRADLPASGSFARPLFAVHHPATRFPDRPATIAVTLTIPGGDDIVIRVSPDVFISQRRFATAVLRLAGWPLPLVTRSAWSATVGELLRRGREQGDAK